MGISATGIDITLGDSDMSKKSGAEKRKERERKAAKKAKGDLAKEDPKRQARKDMTDVVVPTSNPEDKEFDQ